MQTDSCLASRRRLQAPAWKSAATPWPRPRVRDSSSAPLRVCPCTPSPRDMVLAVRDVRDPRPEPRAARHHIRRDARVWAQPKWITKPSRGHQTCRVRLAGRGHRALASPLLRSHSGYAGSNPARDTRTRNPRGAHASRVEIGRNDWAAPEPVTGWIVCFVNSVASLRACKREGARQPRDSPQGLSHVRARSAGLSSRKPRVRLPHEAPDQFAQIAQQVERRVECACVGGSKPSLGTRQNLVSSAG